MCTTCVKEVTVSECRAEGFRGRRHICGLARYRTTSLHRHIYSSSPLSTGPFQAAPCMMPKYGMVVFTFIR